MNLLGNMRWNQVVISLLLGVALGTTFGQWYAKERFHSRWKEGDMKQHMLNRLDRKLHLTPDQKQKIEAIFEAKRPQMMALHEEVRPKFESLRSSTQAEIKAVLDPQQQKKFDELEAKMAERWKRHRPF